MYTSKKRISLDLNDVENTTLVGKALSSEVRLNILKYLIQHSANISEIATEFNLPQSSAAMHVKVLEDAGMIIVHEKPGLRGSQKVCGIIFEDIYLNVFRHILAENKTNVIKVPMSIGNYFDFDAKGNCGLVSEQGYLGIEDSPAIFFSNERSKAQLLWFNEGYVEYRFPTNLLKGKKISEISFSFEICSEAPGYQNDWPSDITVSINGTEVATITAPGDFGDRRGLLNPEWWGDTMTQYGLLKKIRVNELGCFENEVKCAENTLESLISTEKSFISFRLEVKSDAVHVGGMNLFGERFGDYAQALVMSAKVVE